jgi:hypothetical protein
MDARNRTGDWRKLHTKQLHDLHTTLNMEQSNDGESDGEGHVVCAGQVGNLGKITPRKPKWRDQLKDIVECILLKWI